jgi:hypothetical protein
VNCDEQTGQTGVANIPLALAIIMQPRKFKKPMKSMTLMMI